MKKTIQNLLPIVLMICTVFSLLNLPALAAESERNAAPWDISETDESGNVTAWYEGDAEIGYTLHIAGQGRMSNYRDTVVPWTSIKENITEVVVENGVTNVGAYAFNFCRRLSKVSLPDGLTEIGTYAFHNTDVKRLTIPASVDTIGRMIATPNTYCEVRGNPQHVNDHAFSTSLISAVDKASAEALNSKANVSAVIVLNGGSYGSTDADLANLSYGLITPVREGHTFKGWYRDDSFVKPCRISEDGRAIININHIYYAKWSAGIEYTVIFNSQGGSAVASQTIPEGGCVSVPAVPVREGYCFGGWFVDAACTAAWNFNTVLTEDLVLYAKWDESAPDTPSIPDQPTIPDIPGGSSTPGSIAKPNTPPVPDTGTITTVSKDPDGTVTTVVTDTKTGASTVTTDHPDGTKKIVENMADGAVTTTAIDSEGGKIVNAKDAEGSVAITVTSADGETLVEMDIPASIPVVDNNFTDVPSGHYAETAINQAVAMGLVNGVGGNRFDTNANVDRAMAATILCRLAGMDGNSYPNNFTDVPAGHYAADAIAWANKAGVVNGYGKTFGPGADIKRQDMAVMLYRFAKLIGLDTSGGSTAVLDSFQDKDDISGYAKEALAWCVQNGIIQGKGSGIIAPGAATKRCDMLVMIQRFMDMAK